VTLLFTILLLGLTASPLFAQEPSDLEHFDKLWNYGDPAGTEKIFSDLLSIAKGAENQELLPQLLSQIARCQGLQGQFEQAHATLDLAETHLTVETHLARGRILLERGRALNSSGSAEKSIPLFLEALTVARDHDLFYHAVDAAHMLGIVEKPERALEWNLKAIAMAEQTSDERARGWLGPLYNNTGWTFHDLGRFDQAMELFQKGYEFRVARGQVPQARIARYTIARTLRSMERFDEALAMQKEIQAEIESSDAERDGYVCEEIGENLLALGKVEESRIWFAEAWQVLSRDSWVVKNQDEKLEYLKEMAGDRLP
jgi:tetratricopeptide (TPR) repeat protein